MNAQTQTQTRKPESAYAIVCTEVRRYDRQIASILPRHIPSEKFQRILIGAMSAQPDVSKAAASSAEGKANLIREVMKAAQDGIVLDGREGALVTFTRKKKKKNQSDADEFYQEIKYMPMVQGVLKRLRNSGEIASVECEVVYENDFFDLEKGDNAFLKHRPWYVRDNEGIHEPGKLRLAYVSALLKDGTRVREVMNRYDIAKIKAASRSKDRQGNLVGPWKDWEDEMWRKSVLHRAAKYLPKSSDKETGESVTQLLDRDTELYTDVGDANDIEDDRGGDDRGEPGDGGLPATGADFELKQETVDPNTGEIITVKKEDDAPKTTGARTRRSAEPKDVTPPKTATAPAQQAQQRQAPAAPTNGERRPGGASAILNAQPDGDDDDGDLI